MKPESLPPTHYQRIGGEEKVRALVLRFYQLMNELPDNQRLGERCLLAQSNGQQFYQAYGIRKLHAEDLQGATDKLYKFLSGWMGGPHNQRLSERCLLAQSNGQLFHQLYMEQYGHPMLRARHLPFSIGAAERDQWLLCMNQALSEVVEDIALRKELAAAFAKVAEHMRNQAE